MPSFRVPGGPVVGYDDSGGEGPVLVFSHGILMDRSMFAPQVAEFSRDHRCVTWDERGHGETPADGPFSYWDSARDLLALLDHLEVPQATLVGMSQGGYVSLRAALLAPERVDGLVLIDTQAAHEPPEAADGYRVIAADWQANGLKAEVAQGIAYLIIGPGDHPDWVAKWTGMPPQYAPFIIDSLLVRDDLTDRLGEVDAPALVVHGTADQAIPMQRAEALAAGLPRCAGLVRVEGAPHASNLTHPQVVNPAIRSFLGELHR